MLVFVTAPDQLASKLRNERFFYQVCFLKDFLMIISCQYFTFPYIMFGDLFERTCLEKLVHQRPEFAFSFFQLIQSGTSEG